MRCRRAVIWGGVSLLLASPAWAATATQPTTQPTTLDRAPADAPSNATSAVSLTPSTLPAIPAASLFDPTQHMRVSEVRAGMKGYGLSVFKGTKIERFDVEVLSILKNFNPKMDIVLIDCKGANLEHTGSIAGMSGSPVYLVDDAGRTRMLGAFAYGWPMAKDPIAGVTPIEYMLALPTEVRSAALTGAKPTTQPAAGDAAEHGPAARGHWSFTESYPTWLSRRGATMSLVRPGAQGADVRAPGAAPRLAPLATPLMVSGLPPRLVEQFSADLAACGLVPLQAGGGGGAAVPDPKATIEPGSSLVVTLLGGDVEMSAVGTCTEVLGNRVYGFGHPFNNEGAVLLPMGAGRVNGIIATLTTSFKLGSLTRPMGRLTTDQLPGIAGEIGDNPPLIPVDIELVSGDGTASKHFHFDTAVHPKFTPLLTGMAFAAAVSGASDLPQYNTVDFAMDVEFANGRKLHVADTLVNTDPREVFQGVGLAMMAAAENPFERATVARLSGSVKVAAEAREGQIIDVHVPRSKYKVGETVKAFVSYRPFRSPEAVMPLELELPKDLKPGQYQLVISDAERYFQDEQTTQPFRFTAERAQDVFDVLKDVLSVRHNALYVRLIRQSDGVAIGRTAMPQLPSSRRQILLSAGRSNTTAFVSSTVKVIPTDRVMQGSAEFQITIESPSKVDTGSGGGPTTKPSGAGPKPAEVKPKTPLPEGTVPAPMPVDPKPVG